MYTSQSPITIGTLVLNTTDVNGVTWRVTEVEGWGSPGSTIDPVQKPRQSGAWAGESFFQARVLGISGMITAPTPELLSAAEDALHDAVTLALTTVQVSETGRVRFVRARRSQLPVDVVRINNRQAKFDLVMIAPDGRKFGTALSGSTLLPASSGGLVVPFTVPFSIDSTVVSGHVSLTNPGNEVGPVVLRIDGPATGPIITHVGSAQALVFSSSLVLNAGEWLTVDMDKRTALANDQASRNGYITSRGWSGFDPGGNVWSLSAPVYDPATQLTVYGTPAWK